MTMRQIRDHGGGLDNAIARFGGQRVDWIDLSTGINPVPYPIPEIVNSAWRELPDQNAVRDLETAARRFWNIPETAAILAAPGASALIARAPLLAAIGRVRIDAPTYNEHAAAFGANGWIISPDTPSARVVVHPNNPDGAFWDGADPAELTIIDESFCDITPDHSHIADAARPGTLILKSFGKFWGLAGLRLGFAIGDPTLIARLSDMLGPWPVSGPALGIGTSALCDFDWAQDARQRLAGDSQRLDNIVAQAGARPNGGTSLFRLYETPDARAWQAHLGDHKIWSRVFPYSKTWFRLGLPGPDHWSRLEAALCGMTGGAMSRIKSGTRVTPTTR